jgi:manganese transport protein
MEAFSLVLVSTIGACFVLEIFMSKPSVGGIASGFVPRPMSHEELYVAIGILGATVMPHNLYLHSALVQSRAVSRSKHGVAEACKFNLIDSVIALNVAFFVNAAILIVAAAAFGSRGIHVEGVQDAHRLLTNILNGFAPVAFALALLCAGLSSTITGTLAGQITMEGFLHFRMRPWLRRFITRALAIIPAILVIGSSGEKGMEDLLVFSQVVLSLQLPFAVIPLVKFTSSRRQMGEFVTPIVFAVVAWIVAVIILGLNGQLIVQQVIDWKQAAGGRGPLVVAGAIVLGGLLAALLAWLTFKPERRAAAPAAHVAEAVLEKAASQTRIVRRIGVALEAVNADAAMLADAIALAKSHDAELVLMHVVEGAGGHWYGSTTGDAESRHDAEYLLELASRLRSQGVPSVRAVLGYGSVAQQIIALAKREQIDMLILGGHGHRGLGDLFRGTTIDAVRHGLSIPILAVRGEKK